MSRGASSRTASLTFWDASSRTSPCPGPTGTLGARARGAGAERPGVLGVMRAGPAGRRRSGTTRPTGAAAVRTGQMRPRRLRRNPRA
eukprot:11872829-Alexandrium_andersonii.AAC.1